MFDNFRKGRFQRDFGADALALYVPADAPVNIVIMPSESIEFGQVTVTAEGRRSVLNRLGFETVPLRDSRQRLAVSYIGPERGIRDIPQLFYSDAPFTYTVPAACVNLSIILATGVSVGVY